MESVTRWLVSQWDRVCAWAAVAAGAIMLIVGWVEVSGSGYPAEQIPYIISAGLGGIFLMGLGATLWLSADLRDEWRKLDRIEAAMTRGAGNGAGPVDGDSRPAQASRRPTRRQPVALAEGSEGATE
jgi:hypothetical protein